MLTAGNGAASNAAAAAKDCPPGRGAKSTGHQAFVRSRRAGRRSGQRRPASRVGKTYRSRRAAMRAAAVAAMTKGLPERAGGSSGSGQTKKLTAVNSGTGQRECPVRPGTRRRGVPGRKRLGLLPAPGSAAARAAQAASFVTSRKFCSRSRPCCEAMDSGWNCTPWIGRSRCCSPMTVPSCSHAVTSRHSGRLSRSTTSE